MKKDDPVIGCFKCYRFTGNEIIIDIVTHSFWLGFVLSKCKRKVLYRRDAMSAIILSPQKRESAKDLNYPKS
jgi:hypothetical protein